MGVIKAPQNYSLVQIWWPTILEIIQPMGCSACTHDAPCFFSFGGGVAWVEVIFLFIFFVPNVFSACAQHVPLRVPKFLSCSLRHSPMAPQFYLPKVQHSRVWTEKVTYWGNTFTSILQLRFQRGASIWGSTPIFQKLCWWSSEYGSFKNQKKKKFWAHHELN